MGYTYETEDGLVVYAASAVGNCSKALVYDRLGITQEPPPDWLQKAYDEGTSSENPILRSLEQQCVWALLNKDELTERGYEFGEYMEDRGKDYSDQVRVRAHVFPHVVVQAHLDGVGRMRSKPQGWTRETDELDHLRVVEVKAFGKTYWDRFIEKGLAGFPLYQWQMAVQMKGAGLPGLFVVGRKGETTGDIVEIKSEYVDELPVKWLDVIRKIGAIEAVVEGRVEDIACEQPLQYPCPFYKLHDGDAGEVGTVEDDTERRLVISLAEEYERHRIAEKHEKDLKQRAGKSIAEFFDNRGEKGGKVKVGHWQVSDVVFERDGGWDEEAIRQAMPDSVQLDSLKKPKVEVRYPKVEKAE